MNDPLHNDIKTEYLSWINQQMREQADDLEQLAEEETGLIDRVRTYIASGFSTISLLALMCVAI